METNDDWIDASAAIDRFATLYLDSVAAKSTLADHLRDGKLRARASEFYEPRKGKIEEAWSEVKE